MQGKYGGYQIIKDLGKLQLSELTGIVVGPNAIAACLVPGQTCERSSSCTIRRAIRRLDKRFQGLLAETYVLDLIA